MRSPFAGLALNEIRVKLSLTFPLEILTSSLEIKWNRVEGAKNTPITTVFIFSRQSGKCLDIAGASQEDGAELIQYQFHGRENQQFLLQPLKDGYYHLIVKHSGKCLAVPETRQQNGVTVVQYAPHTDWIDQQWQFQSLSKDYHRIVARHSGKCLDVSGCSIEDATPIIQHNIHSIVGHYNQEWMLLPADYLLRNS